MKISCPSCSAKYSIADEKVVSRLAKIRCRKCGATIVIDGKVNPPSVTATSAGDAPDASETTATDAAGSEYSVDFGEGDQRTLPIGDIITAYNAGQITGETYVWADGFADWKPLSEVPEIVDALHSAAGGGAGSKPQAAASPWDAKPAAQPAPERAAARPARGATSDLFGRIDRAGSEEEVATSAPEAAGGGSGTGARNESSVLFSLSALTSASKPSQTGSRSGSGINLGGATSASREDSGLIDLKALTAAAALKTETATASAGGFAAPAMAPLAASPLGVAAPLGLGSPIGAGLGGDIAPTKSKTGLFIAIGIVVAAVIVALALILRPTPPPVVVAPPAPPPPAPAPTPTPTPTLAAAPPPTGAASAEEPTAEKKKPTTGGTIHRSTGTKKPSTGSGAATPPAGGGDAPPPPPKKSNNCGCSPSDLNCNMRCRAKG